MGYDGVVEATGVSMKDPLEFGRRTHQVAIGHGLATIVREGAQKGYRKCGTAAQADSQGQAPIDSHEDGGIELTSRALQGDLKGSADGVSGLFRTHFEA
jgi:hypothetical protein